MNHNLKKYIVIMLSGIIIGYLLAVINTKEETYIDTKTGRLLSVYKAFPLKQESFHKDRAFELLYNVGKPIVNDSDLLLVKSQTLFDFFGRKGTTDGGLLQRAENRLASLMFLPKTNVKRVKGYVDQFMRVLQEDGVYDACEYSDKVYQKEMRLNFGDVE